MTKTEQYKQEREALRKRSDAYGIVRLTPNEIAAKAATEAMQRIRAEERSQFLPGRKRV